MTAAKPPSEAHWRVIVLLVIYAAMGHFNRVGIAVVGSEVFIPKNGISPIQMGWIYTTFLMTYTFWMLPWGSIIDRIGSRRSLEIFGLTMGAFVAMTGALGWITQDTFTLWLGLLIVRGLAGASSAPLHPGAAHVISECVPRRSQASANGLVTAGALVGIAFCYPVFGWLVDRIDWPWAFVICGGTMVAYTAVWHWTTLRLPYRVHEHSSTNSSIEWNAVYLLVSRPNVWLLTFSYAAYGYFQYLFFYWMDFYFTKVLQVDAGESRQAMFYIMLAQGAGMAIGGLSTDAICRQLGVRIGRCTIVVTGMVLAACLGVRGVNANGLMSIACYLAASMAALGMCEGVFWTTATDIAGRARGFSGAFMNTGGNLGGLISPVLTPYMAEQMGWPNAIKVACAVVGLGGAVWFLIRPAEITHPTHT